MSIPKEVRDDTRPRHVRAAEQAIRKGGCLRWDPASRRGRLYDKNEHVVMRMTGEQVEEATDGLPEELTNAVLTVRDGLYAGDVPGDECEKLTLDGILERWPALEAHYADARKIISTYAVSGKLNKTSRGRGTSALYHIDDAFLAWIDSLPLDQYDVDEETPAAPPADEDEPQEAETGPEADVEEEPPQDTAEAEGEDERLASATTETMNAGDLAGDGSTGLLHIEGPGENGEAHDPLDELWLRLHRAARTGDTGSLRESIDAVRERLMQRVQELYTISKATDALETDLDVVASDEHEEA